jgi:transposase
MMTSAFNQLLGSFSGGFIMRYLGADLHKHQITFVGLNEHGDCLLKKRLRCKCVQQIEQFFISLDEPFALAIEAVGFYYWFWDLAKPYAARIYLANATEVRHRSTTLPKTDYRDARRLAELLRIGLFEKDHHLRAFVPDEDLRELRTLTRRRNNLTRKLIREKCSFKKILLQYNLNGPTPLDTVSAIRWLRTYGEKLPEYKHEACWQITDTIGCYERQRDTLERRIEAKVRKMPQWTETFQRLRSIPGIGQIVAWTLIGEIGEMTRFDRAEELVDYAGLAPRVFQSAETIRYGRITKTGPRDVRWMLEQAAWVAIVHDERCQSIFRRIAKRTGRKKAAVAIARKLLVWAYYLAKHKQQYQTRRYDV